MHSLNHRAKQTGQKGIVFMPKWHLLCKTWIIALADLLAFVQFITYRRY